MEIPSDLNPNQSLLPVACHSMITASDSGQVVTFQVPCALCLYSLSEMGLCALTFKFLCQYKFESDILNEYIILAIFRQY